MESTLQLIQENWVGTILGLLALAIAVYELLKRRGPSLRYQFTSQRIVGRLLDPLPAQVSIQFESEPVDHLSKTEVILWNGGPAALRRNDVPSTDPIKISFNQSRILMCEITKIVRQSSDVRVDISEDRASAIVSFEYLDKGDGALLTFWHDGVDTTPHFSGVIIGQKSGIATFGRFRSYSIPEVPLPTPVGRLEKFVGRHRRLFRYRMIFPWFMIVAGTVLTIGGAFRAQIEPYFPFLYVEAGDKSRGLLWTMMGLLYVVPGWYMLKLYSRKFPKELLPPDFASFDSADDLSEPK